MRLLPLLPLCALALLEPPVALAQQAERPLGEALTVAEGGDPCLTHAALADHLATWLGGRSLDARVTVVVTALSGEETAFVIRRDGEVIAARRFTVLPPACPDRRAALSLAMALAIDHTVLQGLGLGAAPVVEEPSRTGPSGEQAASGTAGEPVEPAPPALGLAAVFGIGLLVEVLPDLAYGASATLEMEIGTRAERRLVLRVGALVSSNADITLGGGRAETQLVAARLSGCLRRAVSRFSFDACAGATAGVVFAEGRDYALSRSTHMRWAGPAARLAARFLASDVVQLGLAVDGVVSLARPRLIVRSFDGLPLTSRSLPRAGGVLSLEFILSFT